jgi:hypothetical protein
MSITDFFKKKKKQKMSPTSEIIYNEMNYITNYCVNNNIDVNQCDHKVLSVVSENIGMIYLAAVFSYLECHNLIEEKNNLVDDFKLYVQQQYGKSASYKQALGKVFDLMRILNRGGEYDNEDERIDNWKIWIREILSRSNKASATNEVGAFFGVSKLYDEAKMTDELLKHIIITRDKLIG